ncbi:MAG: pyruvate dehydrogenase complex dihydrolipoamide acetyltransferase [Pseudomonadota bacterium]
MSIGILDSLSKKGNNTGVACIAANSMPSLIKMPALSPTMEHGTLSKWIKKENDKVRAGDILCEIETDKATMELEAVDDGILGKILVQDNTENVAVNAPIAILLSAGETMKDAENLLSEVSSRTSSKNEDLEPQPVEVLHEISDRPMAFRDDTIDSRVFASPLAKRIAKNQSIDLTTITGSGPSGRIVKRDLENVVVNVAVSTAESTKIVLSGMRKVIAKRLTEAKQTIPHFYLTIDIEAERLLAARALMNQQHKDVKITVNDMIVKASGCALLDVPAVNATFHEDHILQFTHPHICVAVAVDGGLITPIVANVDGKNLRAISAEVKALVDKAKNGKLRPEEYQGGTFTISNLGMFGISHFQAIINPPQVAILAVGTVQKSGIMQLTLSVDHRAVDGADAAQFLQRLKLYLEQPELMLV